MITDDIIITGDLVDAYKVQGFLYGRVYNQIIDKRWADWQKIDKPFPDGSLIRTTPVKRKVSEGIYETERRSMYRIIS